MRLDGVLAVGIDGRAGGASVTIGRGDIADGAAALSVHHTRSYVRPFRNERQESRFAGVEGAFRHFGGVTEEVLLDNDRGLVARHDRVTREVEFNARLHAFAKHWGFRPRACAPYRARTKGKDERGVGYVKKNAIAGRQFESCRHWKPISTDGRAMSPISGCTARPARRRLSAFGAPRLAR